MQIARFTTPVIIYKPEAVDIAEVEKIFLVIKQRKTVIEKEIDDALITADGFSWNLTQEETGQFVPHLFASCKIDYITTSDVRYTTDEFPVEVLDSAKDEVIV